MADVAKQLNNPVADLWTLNFQFNRYYLQGEATDRTCQQNLMNFPPCSRKRCSSIERYEPYPTH